MNLLQGAAERLRPPQAHSGAARGGRGGGCGGGGCGGRRRPGRCCRGGGASSSVREGEQARRCAAGCAHQQAGAHGGHAGLMLIEHWGPCLARAFPGSDSATFDRQEGCNENPGRMLASAVWMGDLHGGGHACGCRMRTRHAWCAAAVHPATPGAMLHNISVDGLLVCTAWALLKSAALIGGWAAAGLLHHGL